MVSFSLSLIMLRSVRLLTLPRTGYNANIHWAVPAASGIFTGFGLMSIFLQALNYIVDAYLMFAASAIAGNTFLRSLCGAVFPLFARQMFEGMGIQYAATLLGCLAVVMIPIPFAFYKWGAKIRQKSAYAPTNMGGPPAPPAPADESSGEEKAQEDAALAASAPKKATENGGKETV